MADTSTIRERLDWGPSEELHRRIKRLWVRHSIAEDGRDIPGLISTLARDCVYELVPTGERWEGHDGARAFYLGLLAAFPDIHFDLQDIVIGPQGVIEVVTMTGTHVGRWAGFEPSGGPVRLTIIIHFPWDPETGLFAGERVYFDRWELAERSRVD
jgi:predicted ester cyclase